MAKLAFCDYHNMIVILEKTEHKIDFHQIVDFIEASHIRYALTINPTVYVSHIRQFWSTARIETTNEETKILATIDGKPRTISELSPRRHLKLNDAEGINSLPDTELFENLSLIGYNILPNQRFTFQKGQFSHQWKFLIHTIMQCLSPKSTGFNEFSSNIATAVVYLATNRVYNFSKMIFDGMMRNVNSKGSKFLMYPRVKAQELQLSPIRHPLLKNNIHHIMILHHHHIPLQLLNQFLNLLLKYPLKCPLLGNTLEELHGLLSPKLFPLTSAFPHESTPRVTSLDADKGGMQQQLQELMDLCTSLQRQQTQMAAKIKDQDLEISGLKARVKDKERGRAEPAQEDAPIKKGSIKIGEEVGVERSTELGSNDTKEMVNVLSSIEAANILTSGVTAVSVSLVAAATTVGVPTISGLFPTASAIFTTASVLARDSKIAILYAEEELKMMIEGMDRSNEVIAKHLQEYEQAAAELTIGEKIKLINELVKYQDHHAKILKYQAQQSKPLSKKEQREFYMSVLRSHAGWKTKHFRGMTLEEIKDKFIPVWKQLEDFVPMSSTEEGERMKKKGLKLDQGNAKRMKTSEDVSEEDLKGMMQLVPVEEVYVEALQVKHPIIDWEIHSEGKKDYWKIIRLGGHTAVYQFFVNMLKQFDREDLHQLWALVKETLSIRQATKDKEKELWVELKRLFEPDFEDQLWTHNQNLMHDPLDCKLYDTCGVHHVFTKDQEIFMLVERDYPLKRGLAIVMICNKLQSIAVVRHDGLWWWYGDAGIGVVDTTIASDLEVVSLPQQICIYAYHWRSPILISINSLGVDLFDPAPENSSLFVLNVKCLGPSFIVLADLCEDGIVKGGNLNSMGMVEEDKQTEVGTHTVDRHPIYVGMWGKEKVHGGLRMVSINLQLFVEDATLMPVAVVLS
nr:synaptobrevin, longin-like domain protein [Tanacetum cinerariifolium]